MKVSWDDYSQYMENKIHVPNHQPVYAYIYIYIGYFITGVYPKNFPQNDAVHGLDRKKTDVASQQVWLVTLKRGSFPMNKHNWLVNDLPNDVSDNFSETHNWCFMFKRNGRV